MISAFFLTAFLKQTTYFSIEKVYPAFKVMDKRIMKRDWSIFLKK